MKRIRRILKINAPADPAPAARPATLVITVAMMALAATVLANPQTATGHEPDTMVTKDVRGDFVALATPVGDIGSIGQMKRGDKVVKVGLKPDLVLRNPRAVNGQDIDLSYVTGEDGKSVVIFLDGRMVSPNGERTMVLTAVPNHRQGESYVISLPGGLLDPESEIHAGSIVKLALEPSSDGSTLILRPVISPSAEKDMVKVEGKRPRAVRAATIAPVAEVQAVPTKTRPAKAPRAKAAKTGNTSSAVAASASVSYVSASQAPNAVTAGSPTRAEGSEPRITLLADGDYISQAVRSLVVQSELSVLIEPGDYRRVTLFTRGLKAEETLSLIVRAANGVLRHEGKTWIISPRTPKAENKASGSATGR
ncbi:MAG: hypothetical protein KF857_13050 [Fimbriimonadaceae bacterium]|nr:hypothetical protein [Fimbriimonadaceae bacterium]